MNLSMLLKKWDVFVTLIGISLRFNLTNNLVNHNILNYKVGLKSKFKRRKASFKFWDELLNDYIKPYEGRVYYVNGINTNKDKAYNNIELINKYFNINASLLYNPTFGNSFNNDVLKVVSDLPESRRDYFWDYKYPFISPSSIAVYGILFVGYIEGVKINLIGSSQGSIIIDNAVKAFINDLPSGITYVKNNINIIYLASVIKDPSSSRKYGAKVYTRIDDYISVFLSSSFKIDKKLIEEIEIKGFLKYHDLEYYLPMEEYLGEEYDKVLSNYNPPFRSMFL